MKCLIYQLFIALLVLSGPAEAQDSYLLDSDDVLSMTVYGEKELSTQYKISDAGTISVPLIGEVALKDLTATQAEQLITAKLADGYLVDPSVSIAVAQQRPFYILGEVSKPGSYGYVNNMNVLSAVALAGGFTYRANRDEVEITRAPANDPEDMPVQGVIKPGDIIVVKERFF